VQENSGPLKGKNFWKIPTGLVDSGEDIHLASCREVFEETGIQTEFVGLLCFRHAHDFQFGKSDLLFVCLLKPLTSAIVKQDSEISACQWIELDKYMNQDLFISSPIYSELNLLIDKVAKDKKFDDYLGNITLPIGFMPGSNTLYLPTNQISDKI
jgi:8-oxo-dGTP pyrophosphatase MutT (NUDIX family)